MSSWSTPWLEYLEYSFLPGRNKPGFTATPSATDGANLQPWLETGLFPATSLNESSHGMAQDLAASGVELPTLTTSGRWKSSRMPAKCTERHAAWRGAVTRYYQERGHVTGSCRHRGFESITVGLHVPYCELFGGMSGYRLSRGEGSPQRLRRRPILQTRLLPAPALSASPFPACPVGNRPCAEYGGLGRGGGLGRSREASNRIERVSYSYQPEPMISPSWRITQECLIPSSPVAGLTKT